MEKRIAQTFLLVLISSSLFAQLPESSSKEQDSIAYRSFNPFTSNSCLTRDNKRVLQWAVQPGLITDYFSIERNIDGKNYETIGVLRSINGASKYEFTDEMPTRGNSLYRIKVTTKGGVSYSSDSMEMNLPGSTLISFYPNPADNVLIIRSAFTADILITDGLGKARISRNIGVGPSIIDVSTLEKGVYLLRITDRATSQQQVEKLVKN